MSFAVSLRAGERFDPTIPNTAKPTGAPPAGMVWIPGGEFSMGCAGSRGSFSCCSATAAEDAVPVHRVYVDGFWMDAIDVTNADFAQFVRATGYVTVAERAPSKVEFANIPPEKLAPGSLVFTPPKAPVPLDDPSRWWKFVKGADWKHPTGPNSSILGHENDPVVQVSYDDALAYAKWAGKRLPTEAEWEFAQRGGLAGALYPWGNELKSHGKFMANIWQGHFPVRDTGEDGYAGISPVKSFPTNGYGLYDMSGNVWQWCSDWYRADTYAIQAAMGKVTCNPKGPESSFDPFEPGIKKHVQRGGSFLCTDEYCSRYLAGARGKGAPDTGTNHAGFRCVQSL